VVRRGPRKQAKPRNYSFIHNLFFQNEIVMHMMLMMSMEMTISRSGRDTSKLSRHLKLWANMLSLIHKNTNLYLLLD
jgi:hypothetical protein